jgi:DeoR/GlpR family transcriptional regulator of sugar metabolism
MKTVERLEQIVNFVNQHGFLSVHELGHMCHISEVTVRRDLERLGEAGRIQRTYGGAAALARPDAPAAGFHLDVREPLADRVDILISTSLDPAYDVLLPNPGQRIPIIAESLPTLRAETTVAVDNYAAARAMGRWAADYSQREVPSCVSLLDLTYHLPNTQARSQGFLDGLRQGTPRLERVLSLNAQARYDTAYQLTRDALTAYPEINMIFGVNDISALGALNACRDLRRPSGSVLVIPFGLEGDTLKNALQEGTYCRAGVAMFPEIVGPALIEAALAAFQQQPLPSQLLTPFAILTQDTLADFYTLPTAANQEGAPDVGWRLREDVAQSHLVPIIARRGAAAPGHLQPSRSPRVGFLVRFLEHEWYRNVLAAMTSYAGQLGITIEVVDAEQSLREEVELRRREIARCAARQIMPGDAVLIDDGPIAAYLAQELQGRSGITIVSNALRVLDALRDSPDVNLIATGGALRRRGGVYVGPMAEATLRGLRADKLFLMVSGATLDFGLSHTDVTEVTIKQAMLRSARHVILLADYTVFGHESMVQVAPISVVNTLIADDALPASWRLELSKLGIEVVLAGM